MRTIAKLTVSALVVAGFVGTAQALPFAQGQIFAGVGNGQVKVFNPDGTLVQTLNSGTGSAEMTGSAFDSAGNFYTTNFQSGHISKFDNNGNFLGNIVSGLGSQESIVFNLAGNMYVGRADGDRDVRLFTTTGTLLTQFDVATGPRGSDWIDLAADQQTLFYTSEGRTIFRYNVGTGSQLANFATLPGSGTAFALRLLGDGGLLVADRSNVKRLDSGGNVIQTYDALGEDFFFALNLDPDGTTFWTGGITSENVYRFNIATGALVTQFNTTAPVDLAGLSVFGEITQGGGGSPTVPEPGSLALFALAWIALARFWPGRRLNPSV